MTGLAWRDEITLMTDAIDKCRRKLPIRRWVRLIIRGLTLLVATVGQIVVADGRERILHRAETSACSSCPRCRADSIEIYAPGGGHNLLLRKIVDEIVGRKHIADAPSAISVDSDSGDVCETPFAQV